MISPELADKLRSVLLDGIGGSVENDFSRYQTDPVAFGRDILKHDYPECVCDLMESVLKNRVTLGKSGNSTGKSYCVGDLAVWFLLVFPDSKVFLAAAPPESNLNNILWPKVINNIRENENLFKNYRITNDGIYDRSNAEHYLTKLTIPSQGSESDRQARFSGKHAPHLLFCLDEADAIPEACFNGIETCMSGDFDRLLCTFNPRQSAGRLYRLENNGGAKVVKLSAFDHPNVIYGENRIPGAVTREVTVQRINNYTRPLAIGEAVSRNCFEVPEFLVGAVAKDPNREDVYYPPLDAGNRYIENPQFSHVVLGEYPAQSTSQLISQEWIDRARLRWDEYVKINGERPPSEYAIMGQDVGEFGDDPSVTCFRYPGGFVERLVSWYGVDPVVTGEKAAREYKSRKVQFANVDGIGVGSGVAPYMVRLGCKAYSVKVSNSPFDTIGCSVEDRDEMYRLRDQLIWMARDHLRTSTTAMLPPDDLLIEEMLAFVYWEDERTGKTRVTSNADIKMMIRRSADRFCAYYLTFYDPPAPSRRWELT